MESMMTAMQRICNDIFHELAIRDLPRGWCECDLSDNLHGDSCPVMKVKLALNQLAKAIDRPCGICDQPTTYRDRVMRRIPPMPDGSITPIEQMTGLERVHVECIPDGEFKEACRKLLPWQEVAHG